VHLHREPEWAHLCPICAESGLAPALVARISVRIGLAAELSCSLRLSRRAPRFFQLLPLGKSNRQISGWRLFEFSGHASSVPELGEIITVISPWISHVLSFCYARSLLQVRPGMAVQVELFMESMCLRGKGCTRMRLSCSCSLGLAFHGILFARSDGRERPKCHS
jgi:hypothetical protein